MLGLGLLVPQQNKNPITNDPVFSENCSILEDISGHTKDKFRVVNIQDNGDHGYMSTGSVQQNLVSWNDLDKMREQDEEGLIGETPDLKGKLAMLQGPD